MEAFDTEAEAEAFADEARRTAPVGQEMTVGQCLDAYEEHMRLKGNKASSIASTMARLRKFFPRMDGDVRRMTGAQIKGYYEDRAKQVAVDTHRNELAEVRTFFSWAVTRRYLPKNLADGIVGIGRRRKGKQQLRIDEARKFLAAVQPRVMVDDAALAMAMALVLGLRQSEITQRVVRDVDDDAAVLWISDAKTENGQRRLEVPTVLQEALRLRVKGRAADDLLFPSRVGDVRCRNWLKDNVKRVCRELGLPQVVAHGLRGTHSTLSKDAGQTAHAVAAQLGHGSTRVARDHYDEPGSDERQTMRKTLEVLRGGITKKPAAVAGKA